MSTEILSDSNMVLVHENDLEIPKGDVGNETKDDIDLKILEQCFKFVLKNGHLFYVFRGCSGSYPCHHDCFINNKRFIKTYDEIYELLLKDGIAHVYSRIFASHHK